MDEVAVGHAVTAIGGVGLVHRIRILDRLASSRPASPDLLTSSMPSSMRKAWTPSTSATGGWCASGSAPAVKLNSSEPASESHRPRVTA